MIRSSVSSLLLLGLFLTACTSGCGDVDDPTTNGDTGNVGVIPEREINAEMKRLETHLDQNMSPEMTASWRAPLDKSNGVRNSWLLSGELIVENGRREVWSLSRDEGGVAFSFSLDPNNDSPDRYIIQRPARSGSYIHIVCHDSVCYTVDRFGNLEFQSRLDFETSNAPAATDQFLLVGADTRFFYAWDVVNQRYRKRKRLDEVSGARGVATDSRVYFSVNDGKIHALSLDERDFFEVVWSQNTFSEVLAPLVLNKEAAQLYVATRNDGVVTCYSTHNGAILWSRPTECSIEDEMLVDDRYMKDRLYVITKNGDTEVNGLWAIKTIDPAEGKEGEVLWKYEGANKILALGKEHVYVRTGSPGAYKIAIVRATDGKLEREFVVDKQFDLWYTNTYAPQLIIGANYKGKVGMFFSMTEPE